MIAKIGSHFQMSSARSTHTISSQPLGTGSSARARRQPQIQYGTSQNRNTIADPIETMGTMVSNFHVEGICLYPPYLNMSRLHLARTPLTPDFYFDVHRLKQNIHLPSCISSVSISDAQNSYVERKYLPNMIVTLPRVLSYVKQDIIIQFIYLNQSQKFCVRASADGPIATATSSQRRSHFSYSGVSPYSCSKCPFDNIFFIKSDCR